MQIKVVTRKQYHCPHCRGILSDAYIAKNPFPEISCPSCGRLMRLLSIQKKRSPYPMRDEKDVILYPSKWPIGFFTEYTTNISKGGMFIRTEAPHEMGSSINLLLYAFRLNEPIRIRGEVVHRNCFSPNREDAGMALSLFP